MTTEQIAIVGMSCRFPGGANSPAEFWKILESGKDAITEIPSDRWDKDAYYDPDVDAVGKMYTKRGGFLTVPVDRFDPLFFNMSPKESYGMDPQQRLLLELTWEALESAGINPGGLEGSNTGVFIGVSSVDYQFLGDSADMESINSYTLTGACFSALSGRISYTLGLEGPSQTIDTACSSSMVTVDVACSYLKLGKTDLAVAGGFNLMLRPEPHVCLTKLQALSPDGFCRAFDDSADGYVRAEGGGLVVLKRLSDALNENHEILGIIRGAFVNQDGRSVGISAPSGPSQEKVILSAMKEAGINGKDMDYLETHGTGTQVGDTVEVTAIGNVMQKYRGHDDPLLIGSVKSNIGHMESASGIGGLLKVILSLKNELIPANLHFNTPNKKIAWEEYPVKVVDSHIPWRADGKSRIAGISSFGFTGTNSHLILQEPPLKKKIRTDTDRPVHPLVLSAKTKASLVDLIKRYVDYFEDLDDEMLPHVCHTAATGRYHFEFRAAVFGSTAQEMIHKLNLLLQDNDFYRVKKDSRVVFLFTGQGSQYFGMGRQLYETHPDFKKTIDQCDHYFELYEGRSIVDLLHSYDSDPEQVHETHNSQPLIFALEYALGRLWMSWGLTPSAMVGHSIGEYTAACLAGVFSLEDAMKLVCTRGRLMGSVPGDGSMLAVFSSLETVETAVDRFSDQVSVATVNAPQSIVISGFDDAIESLFSHFKENKVRCKKLTVSHAYHSQQMEPILDEFLGVVSSIKLNDPDIPIISNMTGCPVAPGQMTKPRYWRDHLRGTVLFYDAMRYLESEGYSTFLEIGPTSTLTALSKQFSEDPDAVFAWSLRKRITDWIAMSEALGTLFSTGIELDWHAFNKPFYREKTFAPTYPFAGKSFWGPDVLGKNSSEGMSVITGSEVYPVIGQKIESTALDGSVIFQIELSRHSHYFFKDHVLLGEEVAPGAALMSFIHIAAKKLFPNLAFAFEDIQMLQPLVLFGGRRIGQIIFKDANTDTATFSYVSKEISSTESSNWIAHITGRIAKGELPQHDDLGVPDMETARNRCNMELSQDQIYELLAHFGYSMGSTFRGLKHMVCSGNESVTHLSIPERNKDTKDYSITPGSLDAVIQSTCYVMISRLQEKVRPSEVYIPFHIGRFICYQDLAPGDYRVVAIKKEAKDRGPFEQYMNVFNEKGELCVHIGKYIAVEVSKSEMLREGLERNMKRMAYTLNWARKPLEGLETPLPGGAEKWIVFKGGHPFWHEIARELSQSGQEVVEVSVGSSHADDPNSTLKITGADPEEYDRAISQLTSKNPDGNWGILFLANLPEQYLEKTELKTIELGLETGLRSLLFLTQALIRHNLSCRFYVVTAGGHRVVKTEHQISVEHGAFHGFLNVARLENPDLKISHIDLSCYPDKEEKDGLCRELLANDLEARVSLRGIFRYVARLSSFSQSRHSGFHGMFVNKDQYVLGVEERGTLENLKIFSNERREPGPDEIEFKVVATGLNFRDVLNVLGQYPGDPGLPGNEASGIVTRTGENAHRFKPGDAVMTKALSGGFASHITLPERALTFKPESLTFEEAATAPIAYMTAYYALHDLAKIKPGESILIHAGAGGVGMAAIQLAQQAGATIFATAGSEQKQAVLREMGVDYIMNSRTLDFADEIMEITKGRGVDIILNALIGDFLAKSLSIVADNGRFLEMGKREILTREQVEEINPTISYQAFDLADTLAASADCREDMIQSIFHLFETRQLRPILNHVFPVEDVQDAFRFMSQARHIGKIAVTHRAKIREKALSGLSQVRKEGVYLITGGLGGLGLACAEWIAENGAGTIVLVSRSPAARDKIEQIEKMEARGSKVVVLQGDISVKSDVDDLFEEMNRFNNPVRGIIHAAGILDDGMIGEQNWERFTRVMASKVQGAWHLHCATQSLFLDFFVMFSSVTASMGSMGQSNYGAANAFMNTLAEYRQALGLCAASICWGPWADVGMAAEQENRGSRMEAFGIRGIKVDDAVSVMSGIIQKQLPQATVLDVDWPLFLKDIPDIVRHTFFEKISINDGPREDLGSRQNEPEEIQLDEGFFDQLKSAKPEQQEEMITELVSNVVLRVMGYDDMDLLQKDTPLTKLGFDSLMAVDLRNQLARRAKVKLPVTFMFDYPTIEEISGFLIEELTG